MIQGIKQCIKPAVASLQQLLLVVAVVVP